MKQAFIATQIHRLILATKAHKEKKSIQTIPMKSFWKSGKGLAAPAY
jgi:hypothetical protein